VAIYRVTGDDTVKELAPTSPLKEPLVALIAPVIVALVAYKEPFLLTLKGQDT